MSNELSMTVLGVDYLVHTNVVLNVANVLLELRLQK